MTKLEKCVSCGSTENLARNPKGVIHCNLCCTENNDKTGLNCDPIVRLNK